MDVKCSSEQGTRALSEFVAGTTFDALPAEVVHEAKRMLLDTIGNTLAGTKTQIGDITLNLLRIISGGVGQATVIGSEIRASCLDAAYANHRNGNALDSDDTFNGSHFGCPTTAAALAACELAHTTGKNLLTSIALGFDVGARVFAALGPPFFDAKTKSYVGRPQGASPIGVLACAAAAAKALNLSAQETAHAFGIAGCNGETVPVGKWAEANVLPLLKMGEKGPVASNGVRAALLAQLGTTAFDTMLDGANGILKLAKPETNFELLVRDLGKRWLLRETSYKPWPSCRWTHYPATAFAKILSENVLRPEEIESILVRGHGVSISDRFKNKEPVGMVSCQFNHPHVCAMLAFEVKRGIDWYTTETMNDPQIQAFRKKVDVELEPETLKISEWVKDGVITKIPASVEVKARGKTYKQFVENAWGDPFSSETYFTDSALRDKFCDFTSSAGIEPERAERIIEVVSKLEQVDDLGRLTKLLGEQSL